MRGTVSFYTQLLVMSTMGISIDAFGMLPGAGTESDPYRIESFADFQTFINPDNAAVYWSSGIHTKLMCDLDLAPSLPGREAYTTALIAPNADDSNYDFFEGSGYCGVFNGNTKRLQNLKMTVNVNNGSLFKAVEPGAVVKNLVVENANATFTSSRERCSYAVIAAKNGGIIENCHVTGTISANVDYWYAGVGCIAGYNGGTVKDCSVNAAVTASKQGGFSSIAAVVARNDGVVNRCASAGSVSGKGVGLFCFVAGIVGQNGWDGIVSCCWSNAAVTASNVAGGVVGSNKNLVSQCYASNTVSSYDDAGGIVGNNSGDIEFCYAAGRIIGFRTYDIGGIVGEHNEGQITACLWDTQATGVSKGVGYKSNTNYLGLYGYTTAQMKVASTYTGHGWDLVAETANGLMDIWYLAAGAYPKLYWQTLEGDVTYDQQVNLDDLVTWSQCYLSDLSGISLNARLIGDFDGSGEVNIADFAAMAESWNQSQ